MSPRHRGWGVPGAGAKSWELKLGPFGLFFLHGFDQSAPSGAVQLPGGVRPCRAEVGVAGDAWGGFVALWHPGSAFIYFYLF